MSSRETSPPRKKEKLEEPVEISKGRNDCVLSIRQEKIPDIFERKERKCTKYKSKWLISDISPSDESDSSQISDMPNNSSIGDGSIDFTVKSDLTDATFVIDGKRIYAGKDVRKYSKSRYLIITFSF